MAEGARPCTEPARAAATTAASAAAAATAAAATAPAAAEGLPAEACQRDAIWRSCNAPAGGPPSDEAQRLCRLTTSCPHGGCESSPCNFFLQLHFKLLDSTSQIFCDTPHSHWDSRYRYSLKVQSILVVGTPFVRRQFWATFTQTAHLPCHRNILVTTHNFKHKTTILGTKGNLTTT